ncbi:hypothetical protein B4N89_14340 [Embleya scabrispora]|uniref:DUF2637 domain-containing protein n=1 Tax=Embleya scabrispora TaxID=159449 RepID=A0A1T3NYP1_9ACTN|nr:hypothetical protein [Embleya scabrispora]OPC81959.1 hypothetical protein B4N89_14340 [Embleya scabrispora]
MTDTVYSMRAGRQLDKAKVAEAQAAAQAKQAASALAQAEAVARIAAVQRDAERTARADAEQDKATARAERNHRWRKRFDGVLARRDFVMVTAIMVASVGTAWPAQMSFYLALGMHPALAVLVTAMSEGAAWAGAAMASKAIEAGRPAGLYRVITWGSALAAAALNVAHTYHRSVPLATVLGIASMLGVLLWESYAHSQTEHAGGKTGAQLRAELYRKARFRRVSRRMRDLLASVPGLTDDAAWIIAWRAIHGADPGVTRRTLKRHHKAVRRVGELLADAPESGVDPVALSVLQTPTATLADIAPGGSVLDSDEAVRDALILAFDSARPVAELLGRVHTTTPTDLEQSTPDQHISSQNNKAESGVGRSTGARPRRSTGKVPTAAKSTERVRTSDELLALARKATADWPVDRLTGEAVRKAVRTSAAKGRTLRDALLAERSAAGLHLVVDPDTATGSA